MSAPDVTVMGAGVMGLCAALACQDQGAQVQVIDPGGPGAGASGGLVGALAPHVPEAWNAKKAFQLQALLAAPTFWQGVAAMSGIDPGYARLGRLQPAGDLALAQARAAQAAILWQGQAEWAVIAARGNGWEPPAPDGFVIRDTLTARIAPRRAIAALAGAVTARGGRIVADAAPQGAVIWANGQAGLRALLPPDAPATAGGEKGQAALLGHDARDQPQLFAEGVHIVPQADGSTAIGSTSERHWIDPTATDAALDALIARARALVPALAQAPVLARWAGVRPRWTTRAPLIGPWPGRPGHFIANGGYKIGFAIAPLAGRMLADLILTGRNRIPPDLLP